MQYPETSAGWRKHAGGPVLGGPEIGTCFDVFAVKRPDGFRLYFSWRPERSLAAAESRDGVNWSAPRAILTPRPESGWEDELNRNAVVERGGVWHMWYSGQARGYTRIGYAQSADGLDWTRAGDGPVLIPELPWEGRSVMCPHVMWDGGVYKMWYSGGETYEPDAIGYAESADGINWRRHPANPIISPTPGGWDGDACYKPFALWIEEENRWMLWYNGRNGRPEYIGLATHDGLNLGFERPGE